MFPAQAHADPPRLKLFTHYEWQSSGCDWGSFDLTTGQEPAWAKGSTRIATGIPVTRTLAKRAKPSV